MELSLKDKLARMRAKAEKSLESKKVQDAPPKASDKISLGETPSPSLPSLSETPKVPKGEETINIEISNSNVITSLKGKVHTFETQGKQLNKDQVTLDHLNEEQREAVELGLKKKAFCLIGSAGSGKTTTQRMLLLELMNSGLLQTLKESTKTLERKAPSVLITSFTKVATRNIREAAPDNFKGNCVHIHKVLEYEPVYDEVEDEETGDTKKVMHFEPARTKNFPLPNITHCIIEEAGSVDVDLFRKLKDALPKDCVFIFLGDLNQLPPVYGAAILGFALQVLPVIELKHVYRQDIGPIKELANMVLGGKPLKAPEVEALSEKNTPTSELTLKPMSAKHDGPKLNKLIGLYMEREVNEGNFIPGESVVLCPIRKDTQDFLNITEINRHIAQALSSKTHAPVYEIITKSGFQQKSYYAEGDLVFYEREYYSIVSITPNKKYAKFYGMDYQQESPSLDRWGKNPNSDIDANEALKDLHNEIDSKVEELLNSDIDDLNKASNAPSHNIELVSFNVEDGDLVKRVTLSSSGEINKLQLGYAQTIHSAQGSEWKNVYCTFPANCSFKINREMLYTAITRARSKLTLFYEDGTKIYNMGKGTFQVGVMRQAIKGNTLECKKAHFAKLIDNPAYSDILGLLTE